MITAKREINSQNDKLGSFSIRTMHKNQSVSLPSEATHYREYDQADDFVGERYNENYDDGIARTVTGEDYYYANIRGNVTSSPIELDEDTLSPTSKTMKTLVMPGSKVSSSQHVGSEKKIKVNTRGKATIIAFAAVIISLIVVICLNAVAIASVASSVAQLENELTQTSTELNGKSTELSNVTHPDLTDLPSGYVKPDSTIKVEVPGMANTVTASSPTNWFDRFCDFVSGMFGG